MVVSGDNENAKKIVSYLMNDTGSYVVDAGSLSESGGISLVRLPIARN